MDPSDGSSDDETPSVLFVAGDTRDSSASDRLIVDFARRSPRGSIVVLSEAPLWESITLAVRQRAWMDVPKTERYSNRLVRYATSRSPRPKIIMEDNAARCSQLMDQWRTLPQSGTDLVLVHSVDEALETALDGRASVLLNLSIAPDTHQSPGISTLIYSVCPAVIAVLIEAYSRPTVSKDYLQTVPRSRFAVLRSSSGGSEVRSLLNHMSVNWPVPSPL